MKKRWSGRISRILSWAIIYLGRRSPVGSSTLPAACEFRIANTEPFETGDLFAAYLGLLAVGFTLPRLSPVARCALTAPFQPYRRNDFRLGGVFSVALSRGSPRVGVTNHRALPSSDFPPTQEICERSPRPLHQAASIHSPSRFGEPLASNGNPSRPSVVSDSWRQASVFRAWPERALHGVQTGAWVWALLPARQGSALPWA